MNLNNRISSSNPSIQQANLSQKNAAFVDSQGKSTSSSDSISVNQVIRGKITDLSNNQVKLLLSDNTTITARLNNASMFSIGDTASFKISSVYPYLELEALLLNDSTLEFSTIQKALELANLPKTEKNQQIVHELMKYHLPINKESIQHILHQSYQFKDAAIGSLVLFHRYHIPITKENLSQLEAYRTNNHALLSKIDMLSESIPSILSFLSTKAPTNAVLAFTDHLLTIIVPNTIPEDRSQEETLSFLSLKEREDLLSFFEEDFFNAGEQSKLKDGSYFLRDMIHLLNEKGNVSSPISPAIQTLYSKFSNVQYQNNELGAFMHPQERLTLLDYLEDFSIPNTIKQQIGSGELTLPATLHAIQSSLFSASEKSSQLLLQSEVFQTLVKECVRSNLTLQPKDLNSNSIPSLYEKMYTQANELDSFFKTTLGNTDMASSLTEQTNNMKQSIDFLQTLNQMVSYLQIPLHLKESTVHSELFVYKKKNAMQGDPNKISVLLHLDMEHLGSLDIHVTLKESQVYTKFYLPDKTSKHLFQHHIKELEEDLNQKGYSISSEFLIKKQSMNVVTDFIEKESQDSGITRYTFDIRA